MKFFRSIAYSIIAICAGLCIVIMFFSKRTIVPEQVPLSATTEASTMVVVEDGDVSFDDIKSAASAVISDAKENVKDFIENGKVVEAPEGNTTGEISYDEIVKLQNQELDEEFKKIIAEYNKEQGIVVPDNKETEEEKEEAKKDYKYIINKVTGVIHRIGCILEPIDKDNALYYETVTEAMKDGYKDKCPVCSP